MQKPTLLVVFFLASLSLPTLAAGTNVYKCGSTYSQLPCQGGEAIKVNDIRSGAQKIQSDRAIASDRKIADNMTKSRLKQERLDIAANTPLKIDSAGKSTSASATPLVSIKKTKIFTARVPKAKKIS
jgi:hypothetical protein